MPRFFNTAGPCDPRTHYMLPPERFAALVASCEVGQAAGDDVDRGSITETLNTEPPA